MAWFSPSLQVTALGTKGTTADADTSRAGRASAKELRLLRLRRHHLQ